MVQHNRRVLLVCSHLNLPPSKISVISLSPSSITITGLNQISVNVGLGFNLNQFVYKYKQVFDVLYFEEKNLPFLQVMA